MTPALEVDHLTVSPGGTPVIHDISFAVNSGEIMAVLGRNGAGKTTCLLALAGLHPAGGTVRLAGSDIARLGPPARSRAGLRLVPDDRGLFPPLTVHEHLRLLGGHHRRAEVEGWFPQLAELWGRRAGLLSGGEQQQLALAMALLSEPQVLLVDELSLGLAPIVVQNLLPLLRRAAEETGCGIVMVEQYVDLALGVADHAVVIHQGMVSARGTAADLLADRDLLAASYLG